MASERPRHRVRQGGRVVQGLQQLKGPLAASRADIPSTRIRITGSPIFDHCLGQAPVRESEEHILQIVGPTIGLDEVAERRSDPRKIALHLRASAVLQEEVAPQVYEVSHVERQPMKLVHVDEAISKPAHARHELLGHLEGPGHELRDLPVLPCHVLHSARPQQGIAEQRLRVARREGALECGLGPLARRGPGVRLLVRAHAELLE
mmetsp:Transcript_128105/g.410655  ORF Transcript_128105/g.410655 Transcript_128105/m.410655 type:complete len:206 (-) Transcript_128105:192-809(-)